MVISERIRAHILASARAGFALTLGLILLEWIMPHAVLPILSLPWIVTIGTCSLIALTIIHDRRTGKIALWIISPFLLLVLLGAWMVIGRHGWSGRVFFISFPLILFVIVWTMTYPDDL